MMLKAMFVLTIVCLFAVLAACSGEPPVEVAHENICNLENDDKMVTTVGYFQLGVTMYCSDVSGDYRCDLNFVSAPGMEDGFSVDVVEGEGNNELTPLPEEYTDADLKIQTDSGESVNQDNKVRITGDLSVSQDPASESMVCYMYLDRVELAE